MSTAFFPMLPPVEARFRANASMLGVFGQDGLNALTRAIRSSGMPLAPLKIALLVPFRGVDAIWGPSCQYSAVLAAAEINARGGILGRQIQLLAADAGGAPADVEQRVRELIAAQDVEVLIGVHLSSVRERLSQAFAGQIPYIFTPLYEGGEIDDGTFAIGETPQTQLAGPVDYVLREHGARRWFMIGHDYVWPRKTHRWLAQHLDTVGARVMGDEYCPLDQGDFEVELDRIEAARPNVVMQSLVGSACLEFNRAFVRRGLDQTILRLSGALEENTLMALEPEARNNLYCASSYFSSLDNAENRAFLSRYYAVFGRNAPVQSVLSISCYEGMKFLAELASRAGSLRLSSLNAAFREGLSFEAAKGTVRIANGTAMAPSYLARASENDFRIVARFNP